MGRGRAGVGTHHARVAARGVEGVHDLVEEGHIEGLVEVEELLDKVLEVHVPLVEG